MPKFDHRFDNFVQKKEDLRFTQEDQEIAEDYAISQYQMYYQPQSVVRLADGMLQVIETEFLRNLPGTVEQVFHVDSLPSD